MSAGSPSVLRRMNRDLVLGQVFENGSLSRSQIAARVGLTKAAVSRIARELIEVGLLKEGPEIEVKGRIGRRGIRLEMGGESTFIIGIVVTANVKAVAIANGRGQVIGRTGLADLPMDKPTQALQLISKRIKSLISRCNISPSRILGGGVVVAGQADPYSGSLVHSDTIGWDDIPITEILSRDLDLPFRLEGRPIALLLAELGPGGAAGKRNVALVNNGLGIGGCLVLDAKLIRGHGNMAGQIAHVAIPGSTKKCRCGRTGCLEMVASGSAILEKLDAMEIPGLDPADLEEDPGARLAQFGALAESGNPVIKKAFHDAGRQLGHALDSILTILNPELILTAGVTGRQADYVAGALETLCELRGSAESLPVRVSRVTSEEAAVWLGIEEFIFSGNLDIDRLRAG